MILESQNRKNILTYINLIEISEEYFDENSIGNYRFFCRLTIPRRVTNMQHCTVEKLGISLVAREGTCEHQV